jgi:hypothetical protein
MTVLGPPRRPLHLPPIDPGTTSSPPSSPAPDHRAISPLPPSPLGPPPSRFAVRTVDTTNPQPSPTVTPSLIRAFERIERAQAEAEARGMRFAYTPPASSPPPPPPVTSPPPQALSGSSSSNSLPAQGRRGGGDGAGPRDFRNETRDWEEFWAHVRSQASASAALQTPRA